MTRYSAYARTGTLSAPRAETRPNHAGGLRPGALACRRDSAGWRAMLFGTVAAGALCLAAPRSATAGPDLCVPGAGNDVICSGDQSGGIDAGPAGDFNPAPGTTLHINNLTQDIGPLPSDEGIRWSGVAGNINIISNTGSFAIRADVGMNLFSFTGASTTLNHTGNIFAGATGIAAQSGAAGPTVAGTVSITMNGNIVSGGTGISADSTNIGNGGAGTVTVNFTGNITAGNNRAIRAESNVNTGDGNSGDVIVTSNGNIAGSIGAKSSVVQGNGNSGAVEVSHKGSLSTGGINAGSVVGGDGNSGSAIVSNTGNISAGAITADSIVGGVGNAAAVTVSNTGNISSTNTPRLISAISQAKTNGDAGDVTVASKGNLTGGIGAGGIGGIEAKSLAAGAGNAGEVIVINTGNIASSALAILANSTATGTGEAKQVTITNFGNTSGLNAATRSVSGKAGAAAVNNIGDVTSNTIGIFSLASATSGDAATAAVTSTGNITSRDDGIMARSLSGTGAAANVNVTSTGNITAGGIGISTNSFGGAGAGNTKITINGGTVLGGTGPAVQMAGGVTNELTIGATAALSSLSGDAVTGASGVEIVNNSGGVTGNVKLGAGANVFNNLAGALFNSGSIVDLNPLNTGLLTNAGTFAPGGIGTPPITTTLTGNFVQGAGGAFAVDVGNGTADKVNVSGTAALAGTVLPTIKGLVAAAQQFTILSAAGNIINNGITVKDTLVFDYELLFPNAQDMVLAVTANFTPAGAALTPNQRVTAAHLQSALGAGGGTLGGLFGYLGNLAGVSSYAAALDRLHAEPYLAPIKSVVLGNLGFTDSLMSCPTAASTDASVFIAEGQCAWARMGGRVLNVDRTVENIGYQDKTWSASTGVQFALAPSWFGSIAAGYESSDIKVDNRASATGNLFHIGGGAKYIRGNWQISGALTGGHARYDVTRFDVTPGVRANGDQSLSFLSGRVRAAYVFGNDNAYIKPLVDFDAIGIFRGGILETGAGPVGLNVHGQTDTLFSIAPAVEVGGQFAYGNGTLLRPFARAGVRAFSEDNLKATASFIGSPAGVPAFTVTTPLDQWMGEVSTGLEVLSSDRYDGRISYDGRYGERLTQHGGSVKIRAKF